MPVFLESKLRTSATHKGFTGERADRYVYGAMNNMGAMHGSKETAKGKEMQKKHEKKVASKASKTAAGSTLQMSSLLR
jgi:hypothetical protein